MVSRSVARSAKFFPGCKRFSSRHILSRPNHSRSRKRKCFPEPIDGERLLEAIETVAESGPDAPDLFHILDVLQMCCLSRRSGAVQVVQQSGIGLIYLRDGRIVHVESETARGTEALFEIAAWDLVEFAYDPSARASETISLPWDGTLVQTLDRQKGKGVAGTGGVKARGDKCNRRDSATEEARISWDAPMVMRRSAIPPDDSMRPNTSLSSPTRCVILAAR